MAKPMSAEFVREGLIKALVSAGKLRARAKHNAEQGQSETVRNMHSEDANRYHGAIGALEALAWDYGFAPGIFDEVEERLDHV